MEAWHQNPEERRHLPHGRENLKSAKKYNFNCSYALALFALLSDVNCSASGVQ
jgi:hypothetical protein